MRGVEQAWSVEHLDVRTRNANYAILDYIASILKNHPEIHVEVHGQTTKPEGGAADADLAAHLGLDARRDTQRIMDELAHRRANACYNALVQRGVPHRQLYTTFRGAIARPEWTL